MIKKFLSPEICAECKGCCFFGKDDAWEIPAECYPRAFGGDGTVRCPRLSESGCALGDGKPFECKLYPFRVMNMGDNRVIAVSTYCPEIRTSPLSALLEFAESNRAEMLSEAEKHPGSIKDYRGGYVVLKAL
ncbi:MAG: hypothetical protein LBI38_00985 [Oscillospiraceae bacterium]|jgi:Fe-S-cluster containining protein|nr:hypothetical protein [Oscillospiraceae bacterium]